jgi:ATP synthase protein I
MVLVLSVTGLAFNFQTAVSLFLGGMICVAANLWLALVAFRPALGAAPNKMLAAFYVALAITAYVITQLMAWVYPLLKK